MLHANDTHSCRTKSTNPKDALQPTSTQLPPVRLLAEIPMILWEFPTINILYVTTNQIGQAQAK